MDYFIYEEYIGKNSPFTYVPFEVYEYIEYDEVDYIKYKVLEINAIANMCETYKKIEVNEEEKNRDIKMLLNRISELEYQVDINRETLKNIVEISTDVREINHHSGHSWATISIGGKCQYVKFIDLNRVDMMDIIKFLKRYEAGRHVIDTPYRQIFEDKLYYFKKDNM